MRNLIGLYTQICDEDTNANADPRMKLFQSRYSTVNNNMMDETAKANQSAALN